MSRQETDFKLFRSHLIAFAITLGPALLSIAQKETGLALVYFSFFLVLYREGLPSVYLVAGFSLVILFVTAIVMPFTAYVVMIALLLFIAVYILWRKIKKTFSLFVFLLLLGGICVLFKYAVDFIVFDKIQNRINIENRVSNKWIFVAAASFTLLISINISLLKSSSVNSNAQSETVISTISNTNQLY
jgi:rod shape determining protein RodA